jgi:hypothetical protein
MPIRSISRMEFDAYKPFRAANVDSVMAEVEWFSDEDGIVLGLIAKDRADNDYFAGVLGRDERGTFRAIDVESCIEKLEDARTQLLTKMEAALSSGEKVFPQGV